MIQLRSVLVVADNSGAKTVRCIKILGGFKRKIARLGNIVIVSVQTLRNKNKNVSKVKKKEIYKALIIRTKTKKNKKNGLTKKWEVNSVALINQQSTPVGTRIIGPVTKELKKKKFQKFITISSGTF